MFEKLKSLQFIWFLIILSTLPLFLFTDKISTQPLLVTANLLGYLGLILFVWQIILGSRFIVGKITNKVIKVTSIHIWLGIYSTFLIILHPIILSKVYAESFLWIFSINFNSTSELFISLGRIAFILFLILWLSSKPIKDRISYRMWQRLHYLSYPMVYLSLLHPFFIGTLLKQNPALKFVLYSLIFFLTITILYRLSYWAGFFKYKYSVIDIQNFGSSYAIRMRAMDAESQKILSKPGQYIYLQINRFGESHPFSIMENIMNGDKITLLIKPIGDFTNALLQKEKGYILYLDGAYGDFGKESKPSIPRILIAGSTGVSTFYSMIGDFSINTALIVCNNKIGQVPNEDYLIRRLGNSYHQFISNKLNNGNNSSNTVYKKLDIDELKKIIDSQKTTPEQYYLCGSKRFNKGIRDNLKKLGISKEIIYIESFS
ncbi:MAG: ferric reductase-like transmembrane domain-containing protein [candidate division SR1 bacterium]|nr:ferric reductase-like transmembrane domain-containing protein [candidate division SR1 bacterium]